METVEKRNRLILLVDDLEDIHLNYREILSSEKSDVMDALASFDEQFFQEEDSQIFPSYDLESAFQGEEALECVMKAKEDDAPFAAAFIDVRMPPGIDGIETVKRIWEIDSRIQIILCTAYSDYSWDQIYKIFGNTDQLVLLRKPFDHAEILLLALSMTEKWNLARKAELKMQELDNMVTERTRDLKKALDDVKQLSGLLPICATCKKIRDDDGYWTQIERYISKHSEADFTHGICPDCLKVLYEDLDKKGLGRK